MPTQKAKNDKTAKSSVITASTASGAKAFADTAAPATSLFGNHCDHSSDNPAGDPRLTTKDTPHAALKASLSINKNLRTTRRLSKCVTAIFHETAKITNSHSAKLPIIGLGPRRVA